MPASWASACEDDVTINRSRKIRIVGICPVADWPRTSLPIRSRSIVSREHRVMIPGGDAGGVATGTAGLAAAGMRGLPSIDLITIKDSNGPFKLNGRRPVSMLPRTTRNALFAVARSCADSYTGCGMARGRDVRCAGHAASRYESV
jgi:hypothetical protein